MYIGESYGNLIENGVVLLVCFFQTKRNKLVLKVGGLEKKNMFFIDGEQLLKKTRIFSVFFLAWCSKSELISGKTPSIGTTWVKIDVGK